MVEPNAGANPGGAKIVVQVLAARHHVLDKDIPVGRQGLVDGEHGRVAQLFDRVVEGDAGGVFPTLDGFGVLRGPQGHVDMGL